MTYFRINHRTLGSETVVTLYGELDAHTCVLADNKLEEAVETDAKKLILDCSQLNYISSAGIGVLLAHFQTCSGKNTTMVFFGLQPKVRKIIEILGLERVFSIKENFKEALLSN
ncbi:STAS domain-containing protein [Botryobacter ruber]|uniref:STAS domain-containing protein n=1 Tax=Botryobacter ruber TaxID=2171629 RepID=UPI000E0B9B87|nr:STAS domain-containing protein [Botryobacter ruber]